MIGLLTCLVLLATYALGAEAVRAGCIRRLRTPVAGRYVETRRVQSLD